MSCKYKSHNKNGLYFVSFTTVYWIDVFVRNKPPVFKKHELQARANVGNPYYCKKALINWRIRRLGEGIRGISPTTYAV